MRRLNPKRLDDVFRQIGAFVLFLFFVLIPVVVSLVMTVNASRWLFRKVGL